MNITSNYQIYNQNQTTPMFNGYSRRLEKVLDKVVDKPSITQAEQDLIVSSVKDALKDIIKPSRYIEEGAQNAVYTITSKYAARVPVKSDAHNYKLKGEFSWGKNIFKDMQNYFGEPIFKIGSLHALKNIGSHLPAGVPEHLVQVLSKRKIIKYYLKRYLPIFSRISQDGYNELALNLAKLNDMRLGPNIYGVFDSLNPNNIVTKNGRLFLVDEIDYCNKSYSNTTARLLEVFINSASKDLDSPDAGKKVNLVRKIFKKVVISGSYARLGHVNSKEDFISWKKALQRCKISNSADEIINDLETIEMREPDKNVLKQKVSQYFDLLFAKNHINK